MNKRAALAGLIVILMMVPIASGASPKAAKGKIQRTEVCFTVYNTVDGVGDPTPYQVSGTLNRQKNSRGGGTALLLLHGAVSERSFWDGANLGGVPSMAAQLASAGYDVFAIDRLGYGRSPYDKSGWTLTADGQIDTFRALVTQIKGGTYRVEADATCDGGVEAKRGADKVVLMGLSSGAGLIEYYATRYHDIDGIVPLMFSNQGASDLFVEAWTATWAPQVVHGEDYVYYFAIGPDGYSHGCEDWLFNVDGASDSTIEQTCGPGYFGGDEPPRTATGELITVIEPMTDGTINSIGNVGPTPVLLVFADMDAIFTGPEYGGRDVITPEIEMWKSGCNCDVEVLWQENAGHLGPYHDTGPETTAEIIEWLRSRGL